MDTQSHLPILQYEFEQCIHSQQDVVAQTTQSTRRMMTIPEAMKKATYVLLQTGEKRWIRNAIHPSFFRDMSNVYNTNVRAFQSDSKGSTVNTNNTVYQQRDGSSPRGSSSSLCNQKLALQRI